VTYMAARVVQENLRSEQIGILSNPTQDDYELAKEKAPPRDAASPMRAYSYPSLHRPTIV